MTNNGFSNSQQNPFIDHANQQTLDSQIAQDKIYIFFVGIVQEWPPESVLLEFKRLFIDNSNSYSPACLQVLGKILADNDETEFRHTLKRCCYILINNWEISRKYNYIQDLIEIFSKITYQERRNSEIKIRLINWLQNFMNGDDYQELKLFVSRHEEQPKGQWINRYTSYLLVAQFANERNPIEQRKAAIMRAEQLKQKFKFELAMYVARSQSSTSNNSRLKNPTLLGEQVLRLIKRIIVRKGAFSYENIANIFLKQTENQSYREFKQSLKKYLIFSLQNQDLAKSLEQQISVKFINLYEQYDAENIDKNLLLRTCTKAINYLTMEHKNTEPSPLFILLLSQNNPLVLVIVLLKIVLICRNSRGHLESRIAALIKYYEKYPDAECTWIINFLEIFNITFAIYADNVEYNLIKMDTDNEVSLHPQFNLDAYRIFSQSKQIPKY
jgi:hypothetical protein